MSLTITTQLKGPQEPSPMISKISAVQHEVGINNQLPSFNAPNHDPLNPAQKTNRLWIESALPYLGININTYMQNSVPDNGTPLGRAYTEERKQLHQTIKDEMVGISTSVSSDKKPVAVLFMGLPGAGKSTIISGYKAKIEKKTGHKPVILGIDEVVEKIPEYQRALNIKLEDHTVVSAKDAWNMARIEACHVNDDLRSYVLGKKMNMIYDATGTSNVYDEIINGNECLKDLGYKVKIVYVDISVKLAYERAQKRTENVGRIIVESALTDSTDKLAKRNFMQHVKNSKIDSAKIINNEDQPFLAYKFNKIENNQLIHVEEDGYLADHAFSG